LTSAVELKSKRDKQGNPTEGLTAVENVAKKYTISGQSELIFDVKRFGPKQFDFVVEKPTPPKRKI
jgi:hypothetical protein